MAGEENKFQNWRARRNSSSGSTAVPTGGPQVFMGSKFKKYDNPMNAFSFQYGSKVVSKDAAEGDFYGWSDTERASWGKRLYKAGFIKNPDDYSAALGMWKAAVGEAANYYTFGKKSVTPWEVIDIMSGGFPGLASRGGGSGGAKPYTRTQTSTNVNVPDPESLNAAIKQIFQDQVGRDPEKGELARYRSMLSAQFEKSPDVTTTTVHVDSKGNRTENSKTKQGLSAQGAQNIAEGKVQADPEWGAYQAATKYFNLLQSALAAPTQV